MPDKKAELLNRIEKYRTKKEAIQASEQAKKDATHALLFNGIVSLEAEVREALDVANAAKDAGIDLTEFTSEGIKHRLGFIDNSSARVKRPISRVGIVAGGACGNIDLWVGPGLDGAFTVEGAKRSCDSTSRTPAEPPEWQMRKFLEGWESFREKFYAYIESTCDSQDAATEKTARTLPKTKYGQVWLATLSYGEGNLVKDALVRIASRPSDDELLFCALESETPHEPARASDMRIFELTRLVKE